MPNSQSQLIVFFIGSAGYNIPLDATNRKKFQRLSQIGEIHVLAIIGDGRRLYRWCECGCQFVGVPLSLPRWRRNLWLLWYSAVEVIRLARNAPNLVVVAQSPQHAVVPLLLRCFCNCYNVIVETHGDWLNSPFLYHSFKLKRVAYQILKWVGTWTFRRADAIRTISDATRCLLPVEDKPIYQFPAFTDIDHFINAAKKRAQLLETGKLSQDILFVGSLIRLKGVDDLLTAFEWIATKYSKSRLIYVGEGAKREELQERAKAVALADRVIFTGHLPQRELAEWMASAYCLVLPSLTEGLGRVLIEAMVVGLPLIGTTIGGIPELIEPNINGLLVPPSCPDELAAALDWVLSHPNEAIAMGQTGRQRGEKVFSVDQYVQEYQRMLWEVAEKKL